MEKLHESHVFQRGTKKERRRRRRRIFSVFIQTLITLILLPQYFDAKLKHTFPDLFIFLHISPP
jgi:hypothetical protein